MRRLAMAALLLFCVAGGCASKSPMEVRTHTVSPDQVQKLDDYRRTIMTTVVPVEWNEDNSPHRISIEGNHLTIRTTKENHEAILKYLNSVLVTR